MYLMFGINGSWEPFHYTSAKIVLVFDHRIKHIVQLGEEETSGMKCLMATVHSS